MSVKLEALWVSLCPIEIFGLYASVWWDNADLRAKNESRPTGHLARNLFPRQIEERLAIFIVMST